MHPEPPDGSALQLRTARLDLDPIMAYHAEELFGVLADERLHAYTGDAPPEDVEVLRRRFTYWERRWSPDGSELWLNWALRERSEAAFIGHLQAGVGVTYADVAWKVGMAWQGRGYATEAARALVDWLRGSGVTDIRASIHPGHAASIRVAERAGLRRTAMMDGGEVVWRLAGTEGR